MSSLINKLIDLTVSKPKDPEKEKSKFLFDDKEPIFKPSAPKKRNQDSGVFKVAVDGSKGAWNPAFKTVDKERLTSLEESNLTKGRWYNESEKKLFGGNEADWGHYRKYLEKKGKEEKDQKEQLRLKLEIESKEKADHIREELRKKSSIPKPAPRKEKSSTQHSQSRTSFESNSDSSEVLNFRDILKQKAGLEEKPKSESIPVESVIHRVTEARLFTSDKDVKEREKERAREKFFSRYPAKSARLGEESDEDSDLDSDNPEVRKLAESKRVAKRKEKEQDVVKAEFWHKFVKDQEIKRRIAAEEKQRKSEEHAELYSRQEGDEEGERQVRLKNREGLKKIQTVKAGIRQLRISRSKLDNATGAERLSHLLKITHESVEKLQQEVHDLNTDYQSIFPPELGEELSLELKKFREKSEEADKKVKDIELRRKEEKEKRTKELKERRAQLDAE